MLALISHAFSNFVLQVFKRGFVNLAQRLKLVDDGVKVLTRLRQFLINLIVFHAVLLNLFVELCELGRHCLKLALSSAQVVIRALQRALQAISLGAMLLNRGASLF